MAEVKNYPPYLDYPKPHKAMTNAQKIRSMSDDELAKHLVDIGWDCHLCAEHRRLDNEPLLRGEKCDEKCAEHCLEWLKQPVEGEGDFICDQDLSDPEGVLVVSDWEPTENYLKCKKGRRP